MTHCSNPADDPTQTIIHHRVQSESGEHQGSVSVFGPKQVFRSTLDPQVKAEIASARARGVCPRCQSLKKKVPCLANSNLFFTNIAMYQCHLNQSPYLPCNGCLRAQPSILKTPCTLQANIAEMFLFRLGITLCFFYVCQPAAPLILVLGPPIDNPDHPLNFSTHRRDILTLSGTEIDRKVRLQEVELTQDMGPVLKVLVSRYVPLPRDKTAYEWSSRGVTHRLEMAPYLIGDAEAAKTSMLAYAQEARSCDFQKLLDSSNDLLWNTFRVALRSKVIDPILKDSYRLTFAS